MSDTNIKISLIEPGPIKSRFRPNALQALKDNVDLENTPHKHRYEGTLKRLAKKGNVDPFTLSAEAVMEKVVLCLEKTNPKVHYYVTKPTYIMGYLKRLLPTKLMDKFILLSAGGELK